MNKFLSFCSALFFCVNANAAAFFYSVTGTADNTDSVTHGGSGTAGTPFLMSSLRGATIAANSNPGSTIILPAGTYSLTIPGDVNDRQFVSFNPLIGDLNVNASGITIRGAGPATTIIQQTTGNDRIIVDNAASAANFTFTLDGVTITGGRETETNKNIGGAAIFVGGPTNTTVFTNCIFVNNRINPSGLFGSLGGGALINTGGDCIIVNCTFGGFNASDANVSITSGGAISYDSSDFIHNGLIGTLTVSNCLFINNVATNHGGAITISDSNLSSATANISQCTFIGNKAGGSGGAIVAQSGTLNVTACTFLTNFAQAAGGAISGSGIPNLVRYSRFIGNTAGTPANGNTLNAQTASLTANDNWWGVNTGPNANDVRNAIATTWLQLRHAANPNTIFIPNSTTLTATFLTNSAGTFIPVANLSRLVGLPITFNNAVRGSLSGAQATIQSSGTATALFTANVAGAGSANAVVDNQATTASITIPTGVSSINRVQTTPTNLASVQWAVTFTNAVTNVTAGNFSVVNAGLSGSPAVIAVSPAVGTLTNQWTVTASTGSGFGTLGLNMVNGTGVSAQIVNLPFTGQVYTIDLVPPDTSISAQPPAITNGTSASFSFAGTDTGVGVAGFQCRLDGGTFTNCSSPVNFSGLSDASHTFDVRAIDGAGNTDASPATVTWVVDTIPPTISIGSPSTTLTRTGIVSYLVTYTDVHFNASTLTAGNVTLNKTGTANGTVLVSGSGTTRTVTITNATGDGSISISIAAGTASDTASNTAPAAGPSAAFIVDNTAPAITCPTNVTVNTAAGLCSATNVALGLPVGSDANGIASVTNNALTSYPVGTNIVTWTVRDNVGLSNTCNQLVIVRDLQAPTMLCPADIVTNTVGACPVVVTFSTASFASDVCGLTNVTATPASGSAFLGTNVVTVVARDASGNSNSCTFKVIVQSTAPPAPVLNIAASSARVVLSWTNFGCFQLQYAPELVLPPASNVWTVYPGPYVPSGGYLYVTNAIGPTNRFFRLGY
jgi:predicted outer membrane repeat protein